MLEVEVEYRGRRFEITAEEARHGRYDVVMTEVEECVIDPLRPAWWGIAIFTPYTHHIEAPDVYTALTRVIAQVMRHVDYEVADVLARVAANDENEAVRAEVEEE